MKIENRVLREESQTPHQQERSTDSHENPADQSTETKRVSIVQPSSDEQQWRAEQKSYWERQLNVAWWMNWITLIAAIVGLAGLYVIWKTLEATQDQTQVAIDTLHSQRPYVSIGRADGVVAEYVAPTEEGRKGTVLLYFQNTGPVAATNFLVNVMRRLSSNSPLRPQQEHPARHIERWLIFQDGKRLGKGFTKGATVGASSAAPVEVLHPDWTPTPEEWKLITVGKSVEPFWISGNLEYCDSWGQYHCEMFDIDYRPAPVSRFVSETMGCMWDFPNSPDPREYAQSRGRILKFLPACEQPGERRGQEAGSEENNTK